VVSLYYLQGGFNTHHFRSQHFKEFPLKLYLQPKLNSKKKKKKVLLAFTHLFTTLKSELHQNNSYQFVVG
jgi:hypothetical protein